MSDVSVGPASTAGCCCVVGIVTMIVKIVALKIRRK